MSPVAGQRLGPYEILARIGAGGIGEVWRARDTRLDRSVAIKMLPAEMAASAQLRARFDREARSISQLSHPNICSLFDVGDDYLVMELLEGESLADRLTRGPLPLDQALRVGIEIASALDCAHRSGIVHRDLKPGNVTLTRAGAKLLDFGLAKALGGDEVSPDPATAAATAQHPLTEEGTIIGTYQYMSPEQLTGGAVDHRSDIFALGALLYEMITGRRAFDGKSKSSVIASILDRDPPPLTQVNPEAPPPLERVVAACLAKDPNERWQNAHDVGLELKALRDGVSAATAAAPLSRKRRMARSAAVVVLIAAAVVAGFIAARRLEPKPAARHFGLVLPPNTLPFDVALSPDGSAVAYFGFRGNARPLLVHSFADDAPRVVYGGPGRSPFWSPDGRWIAYFSDRELFKIAVGGGEPIEICTVPGSPRGGSWGGDDTIIFGVGADAIFRVSASGGLPSRLTAIDTRAGEVHHVWPSFLPDGKHFLYLADATTAEQQFMFVGSLDPAEPKRRLLNVMSNGRFAGGYLFFVRAGTLMAQPFDAGALKLSGTARAVAAGVADNDFLYHDFSVSDGGMLAFASSDTRSRLHLFDRSGKELGSFGEAADWASVEWSPDGRSALSERLGLDRFAGNLWMFDLARGTVALFTTEGKYNADPVWSSDGSQVLFVSVRDDSHSRELVIKRTDGAGGERVVGPFRGFVTSWNGDWLTIETSTQSTNADAEVMSLTTGKRVPIARTALWENGARLSPDGKLIVYDSGGELMIQPFPPTGARVPLASGIDARWRSDSREIAYFDFQASRLMTVPIAANGTAIEVGTPQPLFAVAPKNFKNRPNFAASPDLQRFLVNIPESNERPLHVITNWASMLR